jgi:hypothetical protein
MLTFGTLVLWAAVALTAYGLYHAGKRFFSPGARERRRRRRNYSRPVSRRHEPSVKLAAKVDRD